MPVENGGFDSDTDALIQRENANKIARYDLEEWIFEQVELQSDINVLDLGCGTGKQIFALDKLLLSACNITGIDISKKAVESVNTHAKEQNLKNIQAINCELDKVPDYFEKLRFDLIMSSYAVYYSRNIVKLLSSLSTILNKNGQMFICGYGKGTNQELNEIINKVVEKKYIQAQMEDFIGEKEIAIIGTHYSTLKISRLANQIYFDSPDKLFRWWKNHNSFVPEVSTQVFELIKNHFQATECFSLSKNVLGIQFIK
jgi:ubiquinone/menaquinone biosynthesis C-methylase UbiE